MVWPLDWEVRALEAEMAEMKAQVKAAHCLRHCCLATTVCWILWLRLNLTGGGLIFLACCCCRRRRHRRRRRRRRRRSRCHHPSTDRG